jgi:hypothetical protein
MGITPALEPAASKGAGGYRRDRLERGTGAAHRKRGVEPGSTRSAGEDWEEDTRARHVPRALPLSASGADLPLLG